jgi:hypothetical protein
MARESPQLRIRFEDRSCSTWRRDLERRRGAHERHARGSEFPRSASCQPKLIAIRSRTSSMVA